jgi:hypothetical protein
MPAPREVSTDRDVWDGLFDGRAPGEGLPRATWDEADLTWRCPDCFHEVAEGECVSLGVSLSLVRLRLRSDFPRARQSLAAAPSTTTPSPFGRRTMAMRTTRRAASRSATQASPGTFSTRIARTTSRATWTASSSDQTRRKRSPSR